MIVPYLSKKEISKVVSDILLGYQERTGKEVSPPIPVEDIIETFLGLTIGLVDFNRIKGMENVLGATYVDRKLIAVHKRLLTDRAEGRLAFTYAHEAGHWCLHRSLVNNANRLQNQDKMILCRQKDAKKPIEWQADYFAGAFLMPRAQVEEAFYKIFATYCIDIHNVKKSFTSTPFYFDFCAENWHHIAGAVCYSGDFLNVSKQAMIIKLQELGLVCNHTDYKIGKYKNRSKVLN